MNKFLRMLAAKTRKAPHLVAAAIALLAIGSSPALAYRGGWYYNGPLLVLGDRSDTTGLYLSNSPRYCGAPASVGSAEIRRMLSRSLDYNGGIINWYVDEECDDGYKRVCITTSLGEEGCNTYKDHGWGDFNR